MSSTPAWSIRYSLQRRHWKIFGPRNGGVADSSAGKWSRSGFPSSTRTIMQAFKLRWPSSAKRHISRAWTILSSRGVHVWTHRLPTSVGTLQPRTERMSLRSGAMRPRHSSIWRVALKAAMCLEAMEVGAEQRSPWSKPLVWRPELVHH